MMFWLDLTMALGMTLIVGLGRNAIALDCSALTAAQIELLTAPGVCEPGVHEALETAKDAACDPVRRCQYDVEDCPTIGAKLNQFNDCIAARQNVNNTCFCGGNTGHRKAIDTLRNGAARCQDILLNNRCRDCP